MLLVLKGKLQINIFVFGSLRCVFFERGAKLNPTYNKHQLLYLSSEAAFFALSPQGSRVFRRNYFGISGFLKIKQCCQGRLLMFFSKVKPAALNSFTACCWLIL